jgi:hypothetical protein
MTDVPDEATHQGVADSGAEESHGRIPTWVWVILGTLAIALVAVTLALFAEARDTSENAKAASASASQLLDDLVGNVKTTNVELKEFNDQFASASDSAQENASSAQDKKSERSSSRGQSP